MCCVATTAHAALIAYDSFSADATPNNGDYNQGVTIKNQTITVGSSGFDPTSNIGRWIGGNTTAIQSYNPGLTHPSMTGTALDGSLVAHTTNSTGLAGRRQYRAIDYTPADGTYYLSFLMRKQAANTVPFFGFGLSSQLDVEEQYSGWSGTYLGIASGGIGFSSGGGITTTLLSAANTTVGETYLGLMEITYNSSGTDSVVIKIYDGSSTLAVDSSTLPNQSPFTGLNLDGNIQYLTAAAAAFSATNNVIDEFRFGTELSDVFLVSAVPEQSSVVLLAPALACLLLYARRRLRLP